MPTSGLIKRWHLNKGNSLLPTTFFVVSIIGTFVILRYTRATIRGQQELDFQTEAVAIHDSILDTFDIQLNTLYGSRSFFDSSIQVEREEWESYVENLDINNNLPGLQGIGYAEIVKEADLESHTARIKAEGFPNYAVWPVGERSIYTPIVYLEPFNERNQRAFGFDMYQEDVRRKAMEYARDNNTLALSGKVRLVQETESDLQPGFLLYLPVYKKDTPTATQANRQENAIAYVYSPFRATDFMRSVRNIEGRIINIEIFDGADSQNLNETRLLFTNKNTSEDSNLTFINTLDLGGHTWTIRYTAPNNYSKDLPLQIVPYLIVFAGFAISVILFLTSYHQLNMRTSAELLAENMTRQLRLSEEALKNKLDEAERLNKLMIGRELKMVQLKKQLKDRS